MTKSSRPSNSSSERCVWDGDDKTDDPCSVSLPTLETTAEELLLGPIAFFLQEIPFSVRSLLDILQK